MKVPPVLVAAALVIAALVLPAAAAPLNSRPPGVIGMGHEGYTINGVPNARRGSDGIPVITIHRGDVLRFQNDSRWVHIIGPGSRGLLAGPGAGAMTPLRMLEENDVYATPAWTTPGEYLITCTVHPEMNAKVVVLP
ncbi:MAG: hypothetical protein L0H41_10300 [Microlunatus sp.]|nr:hypothetical protein [Microlunatus sp.]MDN5769696.1 hypothetical protein [Microlunatus sp.]MDN5803336.1 hypothetical protein [Microlunatus sp.]